MSASGESAARATQAGLVEGAKLAAECLNERAYFARR